MAATTIPGLVSVITPVCNGADFIAETLESIRAQDYPSIEHLVLDDGSTDGTPAILDRYGGSLRRFAHANMGETRTVNAGFAAARGEFVSVVNADDPLRPHAIRRLVDALRSNPVAVLAYPDWEEIDAAGCLRREIRLPGFDLRSLMLSFNAGLGPGVLVRRTALEQVGPRDTSFRYAGDIDLWFRLAAIGPLVHVPELLATHRVHPAAASSSVGGARMARELVAIGRKASADPRMLAATPMGRRSIMARAHFTASFCCSREPGARVGHLVRSLAYAPSSFASMLLRQLRYRAGSALPPSSRQGLRRLLGRGR